MATYREQLMRRAVAAISEGDVDALIAMCDPEFEMHLIGVAEQPVFYKGADGIREYFRDMEAIWEAYSLEPMEIEDLGDRVLLIAEVRARGLASGAEVGMEQGVIIDLKGVKATRLRSFNDVAEARTAAGRS